MNQPTIAFMIKRDQETERRTNLPKAEVMTIQADLQFENLQALFVVQALLGVVTEHVRAVTINCSRDSVDLTFVLYREDPETREEIFEEFLPEFEALQQSNIPVSVKIVVNGRPFEEGGPELEGRVVFLRKEPN